MLLLSNLALNRRENYVYIKLVFINNLNNHKNLDDNKNLKGHHGILSQQVKSKTNYFCCQTSTKYSCNKTSPECTIHSL